MSSSSRPAAALCAGKDQGAPPCGAHYASAAVRARRGLGGDWAGTTPTSGDLVANSCL